MQKIVQLVTFEANRQNKSMSLNGIGAIITCLLLLFSCNAKDTRSRQESVKVGAENVAAYLPLLKNKNVAIVTNQTGVLRLFDAQDSVVGTEHLVDFLLRNHIKVKAIFAPEHGFRGKEDAGAIIENGKDIKTGLPIYSLHGKHKKPQREQLKGVDVIVFDIQDVGVRFYTYISTLHYVMEASAENNILLVVLDRPNPNGHYVDGAVLEKKYQSFIGMHPVPVVYGMTIGEYAQMINGEHWLPDGLQCKLKVTALKNWTHRTVYELPIKPSPNLPNSSAVNLYPSLCFFEQTSVSVGRGTAMPFQIYGSPFLDTAVFKYVFVPQSTVGAKYPKHENKKCFGENLQHSPKKLEKLSLKWLLKAYKNSKSKEKFFKKNFEYLSGTRKTREQIISGCTEQEIRKSWEKDLDKFKKVRKKYLIYPDFEE